jgi:hypothetical protein
MKISKKIIEKYKKEFDPELDLFLENFDEPEGSKILEIGAHDNPVALILAESGFIVHGVDLREYDQGEHENYTHNVFNFLKIPTRFLKEHAGTFDAVISISALEHFGLGTYSDTKYNPYADVAATQNVYNLLKSDGYFSITVPYGGRYVETRPHWKTYDFAEVFFRFGLNFQINSFNVRCVEKIKLLGCDFKPGDKVDNLATLFNLNGNPGVSIFAKFWKVP